MTSRPIILIAIGAILLAASPAQAFFHFMQIEQVIGGVDGSSNVQAIQLRMRFGFQNLVASMHLIAHDATGANPVVLYDFTTSVAHSGAGTRILVASAGFTAVTSPSLTPDFVLTNQIPASYLPAGSLTYEDDFGTIYWRLSWGGAGYTGSGAGSVWNDADGNFSPPFAGPLPSFSDVALRFQFASSALSTNNAIDYALTEDAAVFTNNAGISGTIVSTVDVGESGGADLLSLGAPFPNPVQNSMAFSVTVPREAHVRVSVFDLSGREVRSLVSETMSAGRHSFSFGAPSGNGIGLSSGIYFLALTVEGERRQRRFVVLR